MKRCPNSRIPAIVATLCLSLMAVSAFAQLQTGNIYGKTQAKDGSALPGVTVTLTGNGAPQTTVTDASGNFRFPNLSPGSYTVKAELAGFGTATRAGLTVNVGQIRVLSFTADPVFSQNAGAPVTLSWQTQNATSVVIVGNELGPQTLSSSGTLIVKPITNTTYTLTAYGPGGQTVSVTIEVFVR